MFFFFWKNHTENVMEKLVSDSFLEIKIVHISGSTMWNVIMLFFVCPSWDPPKYIRTRVLATCFDLIYSFFNKQKESWNYGPCPIVWKIFEEKYFSQYFSLNFIFWLPLLKILYNMCIVISCCLVCDAINFEIKFSHLIKPFFTLPKIKTIV